jgi:hypothetical protein
MKLWGIHHLFFSLRPTHKQIHTNKISKIHIYIGAADSSMHLYEGSGHCVRLLLNDNILTLTEKMLCSTHEGEQLPHCWAHMMKADHTVTYMLLLQLYLVTILEVQTKSTNCTLSPTTETTIRSDSEIIHINLLKLIMTDNKTSPLYTTKLH